MRFDFSFGRPHASHRRDDEPLRILLLADLKGASPEPAEPLARRPIVRVDVDNLDEILARHAPVATVGAQGEPARLEFRRFDDFHPDALVKHGRLFARLLDLRARLQNPSTFAGAAAELGADAPAAGAAASAGPPVAGEGGSVLERLLGQRPAEPAAPAPPADAADALIRRVVAPHVVAAPDARLPHLLSAVDVALGDAMRSVLHDPAFQQVEATWRGLAWLVSSLELGEDLELHLVHVAREELPAGLGPLHHRLIEQEARTAGGLRFEALVGAYRFGAVAEDLDALEALGGLAAALGVPFVAEADASLLGSSGLSGDADPRGWRPLDPEVEKRWRALRSSASARRIGLALPRILLRLPYGTRSDRIESFAFDEMPATPDHERFLWGNAALAVVVVLARVLDPENASEEAGDLAGLPAYVYGSGDDQVVQPCAETTLSERALDAMLARGLMPLVSIKGTDRARLIRLQSIAEPPTGLLA